MLKYKSSNHQFNLCFNTVLHYRTEIVHDCHQTLLTVLVTLWDMRPPESSAETKVSKFYVTIMVKEDVVRFDIPVDEAHLVDWLYSHGQLSNVKSEKWKNIFMPVTETFAENTVQTLQGPHQICPILWGGTSDLRPECTPWQSTSCQSPASKHQFVK